MEFDPFNNIIRLCAEGMNLESKGKPEEANQLFLRAWNEATNDFEKFIAAHFVARYQQTVSDKLKWLETALEFAIKSNSESAAGAFPSLHSTIAKCYEKLNDSENAKHHRELSISFANKPTDKGPFYHGTKADLPIGEFLIAGKTSNYKEEVVMNHIYFTALLNGAGLAAALAKGEGRERVYIVEPTGNFENDPNVTDKKFPGNPTRSFRTQSPLKIIGEITDWEKQAPADLQKWRDKLANNKGEIIN